MKIISIMTLLLVLSPFGYSQNNFNTLYDRGVIEGTYISYYSNGLKKAEGNFKKNLRDGKWKLWDSTGNLRIIRNYGEFNQFSTELTKNESGEILDSIQRMSHKLKRNEQGYFDYSFVQEKSVPVIKRLWRDIPISKLNEPLFKEDKLFERLVNAVLDSTIDGYTASSNYFEKVMNRDSLRRLVEDVKVVRYRIKEDWFYDTNRQLAETRILGICPVVKKNSNEFDLVWLYYPHIRELISREFNFDDIFISREFNSLLTKESNLRDVLIEDYSSNDIQGEIMRIESALIELEHDQWLKMTD